MIFVIRTKDSDAFLCWVSVPKMRPAFRSLLLLITHYSPRWHFPVSFLCFESFPFFIISPLMYDGSLTSFCSFISIYNFFYVLLLLLLFVFCTFRLLLLFLFHCFFYICFALYIFTFSCHIMFIFILNFFICIIITN